VYTGDSNEYLFLTLHNGKKHADKITVGEKIIWLNFRNNCTATRTAPTRISISSQTRLYRTCVGKRSLKFTGKETISLRSIFSQMLQTRVSRNKKPCKTKKKGLEKHYQLLIDLTPRDHKLTCLDIEVEGLIKNSSAVSS
jgi:hypothetical protein